MDQMEMARIILLVMLVIGLFFMGIGNKEQKRRGKIVFSLGLAGIVGEHLLRTGVSIEYSSGIAIAALGIVYVFVKFAS